MTRAELLSQAEGLGWPVAGVHGLALGTEAAWRAAVARAVPDELDDLSRQLADHTPPPTAEARMLEDDEPDVDTDRIAEPRSAATVAAEDGRDGAAS